jgi:predicted PurR-regulated permease PerM
MRPHPLSTPKHPDPTAKESDRTASDPDRTSTDPNRAAEESDRAPRDQDHAPKESDRAPKDPDRAPKDPDQTADEAPVVPSPISIRSLALTIVAALAITFALREGRDFVIPLVLAVLISYALDPVVTWIARAIPRAIAAAIVLLVLTGGIAAGAYALRGQFAAVVEDIPAAATRFAESLRSDPAEPQGTLQQVQRAADEIERAAETATGPTPEPGVPTTTTRDGVLRVRVEEPPIRVRDYLWWGWAGLMGLAAQLIAVLFLVYFMLVSGDLFKRKLVQITGPTLSDKKITVQILDEINRQVERFLLVQVFTSMLVGIFSYLAFWWIGLQQAAVWAIAAALFNTIPYFGPAIVSVGVTIVAYVQFDAIGMALLAGGAATVITGFEGFLLKPWLTSRAASMNAVAIFVGLLFFTWLWGVWGTLLAVPMMMVFKAVADRIEDLNSVGELLGE